MKLRLTVWFLCLSLASGLLGGCGLLSKDSPKVASVTLSDKIDSTTKAALTSLATFPKDSKLLYASVKVLNPQKGTKVEARWFLADRPINSSEVTFTETGDRHVAFSLTAREPFPPGEYKVQIWLDGKLAEEKPFGVD